MNAHQFCQKVVSSYIHNDLISSQWQRFIPYHPTIPQWFRLSMNAHHFDHKVVSSFIYFSNDTCSKKSCKNVFKWNITFVHDCQCSVASMIPPQICDWSSQQKWMTLLSSRASEFGLKTNDCIEIWIYKRPPKPPFELLLATLYCWTMEIGMRTISFSIGPRWWMIVLNFEWFWSPNESMGPCSVMSSDLVESVVFSASCLDITRYCSKLKSSG